MAHTNNEEEGPNHRHFSHDHPLEKVISDEGGSTKCAGCNMTIAAGREFYTCRPCSYSLHRICFKMPELIQHAAEPGHDLMLRPMPSFQCKACGLQDSGFSYNCSTCGTSYHALCTSRPSTGSCASHQHVLKLQFFPPYEGLHGFSCDVCGTPGTNQWLYRCDECEFDVHLNCIYAQQLPRPQA